MMGPPNDNSNVAMTSLEMEAPLPPAILRVDTMTANANANATTPPSCAACGHAGGGDLSTTPILTVPTYGDALLLFRGDSTCSDASLVLDPHQAELANGGTMTAAILGIVKGMVGPAILYLPHGFVNAGYMVALPIMGMATALYLHSSKCLLEVWTYESSLQLVPFSTTDISSSSVSSLEEDDNHKEQRRRRRQPSSNHQQERFLDEYEHEYHHGAELRDTDGDVSPVASPAHQNHNFQKTQPIANTTSTPTAQPSHHHPPHHSLSYPTLAYRAFGSPGETLVQVGIALMQSGVCLTYLIFVPHNLQVSCYELWGMDLPTTFWLWVMVAIQIPLSWIRDIRTFATTNAMANLLISYGLILCLWFAIVESIQPMEVSQPQYQQSQQQGSTTSSGGNDASSSLSSSSTQRGTQETNDQEEERSGGPIYNWMLHVAELHPFGDHWILFIGTSVLLFEGSITLLLPLQESVQETSFSTICQHFIARTSTTTTTNNNNNNNNNTLLNDRERFPLVYPRAIVCIMMFYFVFAMICWMGFGNDVNVVLTTSLPDANLFATSVQLAYSVAVLLTFPLQNYPALDILCHGIAEYLKTHPCCLSCTSDGGPLGLQVSPWLLALLLQRNVLAALLVCALAMVAWMTMEQLDKVVSLTGAMIGIPIAFMIPPLMHNRLMPAHLTTRTRQIQNNSVAALGLVAMVLASVTTLWQWND